MSLGMISTAHTHLIGQVLEVADETIRIELARRVFECRLWREYDDELPVFDEAATAWTMIKLV